MTPNRFDHDLDELFAPDGDTDRLWIWVGVAYWALMLALLATVAGLAPGVLADIWRLIAA